MKQRFFTCLTVAVFFFFAASANAQNYKKETYQNDPMNAIHYTLDNGLQVFMSVNKDVPRIQTYIAVRVGSKNDPAESTGLSHYLEHLMFKGTKNFGTINWEKEQEQLKKIEALYEVYNHTTDPDKRKAIYHQIDSVSYEASKYAIPNEYDKLMNLIGSQGTNAFTSDDVTVYMEDIPSNELERWVMIESDRFSNAVFRLFHTELETVYEEKNMITASDGNAAYEALVGALFPHHPYGTQSTIGDGEHLKNPSLTNIIKHYNTYYVPNNYCISMAGDFDPDEAIRLIDKYFGKIQPRYIPDFTYEKEKPIREVKEIEVYGVEADHLDIAFRIDAGSGSRDVLLAHMTDAVLMNGSCGIIDENINQKQLAQYAYAGVGDMNDYAYFQLGGTPKQGQTLEQLKDLLLQQLEILKSGNWDEKLLTAAITNRKLGEMSSLESNSSRAINMAFSYLSHRSWQDVINDTENMSLLTKEDIIDFANRIFKKNNYVVVYKRQGEKRDVQKVDKPEITPIVINRDEESQYMKDLKKMKVTPIEPLFVDFNRDMKKGTANGNEVLYVQNTENGRFQLTYRYNYGKLYDKNASITNSFLGQLESENRTLNQINREMYDLACSYSIYFGDKYSTVSISGLSENMDKALVIVEDILNHPKISEKSVKNSISDILKSRDDAKTQQGTILQMLVRYACFGKDIVQKYLVTNDEVQKITAQDIINQVKTMTSQPQRILYYGDMSFNDFMQMISNKDNHNVHPAKKPVKMGKDYDLLPIKEAKVYFAHYDAKQSLCRQITTSTIADWALSPVIRMYNAYFGGSMNSIVFQELREKRSLAYTAAARYVEPGEKGKINYNITYIGTQNDKLIDAMEAFNDLLDNMPHSELKFELAKNSLISQFRASRVRKMSIINNYLSCEEMGLKAPRDKEMYNAIQKMTLNDVVNFNKTYIKGQKRAVAVLGNKDEVDLKAMEKYGKVTTLSLEEIFGY